ncbi:MAG: superfamily I DNA/RNA helicase [Psychromonas sp.]|jgi:superfamily I DNA/RNA helicase|uniref:UvrD-helicase domain-containing protein n=1 Tax=Psychromonas sp. TaxID=1884585 RepID=UPI0039E3CC32
MVFVYRKLYIHLLIIYGGGGVASDCDITKKLSEVQLLSLSLESKTPSLEDIYNNVDAYKKLYDNKILWMSSFSALALYVIKESSSARRYIYSKYTQIFIDEYQDSSNTQHKLFLELVNLGLIGTAVGDVDQSIYGFRGSNPQHLEFLKTHSNIFESFFIDINHRCHPSIINYASRLKNPACKLIKNNNDDCRVYRYCLKGSAIEGSAHISTWISEWLKSSYISKLSKVGIFAKKEATLKLISKGLTLKHRLYIDTPLDDINAPIADLYAHCLAYKFSLIDTAQELIDKILAQNKKLNSVNGLVVFLRKELKKLRKTEASLIVEQLHKLADYLEMDPSEDADLAVAKILTDESLMGAFRPLDENEIQLMTLHKSKGLEFKIVFNFDMEEWSFPYRQYTGNFNDPAYYPTLLEETNLHYVGITRAEELCILIQSELRPNINGVFNTSKPSYFFTLPQLEGLYC